MIAIDFKESNTVFGPPEGLDESQVRRVPAFVGQVERGSIEGLKVIVLAWQPSAEEIKVIVSGKPIFISILGNLLPPHMLTTSFEEATQPG